ncbi:MAG TPA: AMP-binding protein, partial [Thermoanaerobaculia bacterium]|nr:AMP-binding protein [Thermoanaerobaculia bacterium]
SCVRQAGLRHVITSRRVAEKLPFRFDVELVYMEDLRERATRLDKLLAAAEAFVLPAAVLERRLGLHRAAPDDLLTVIFTSGSTGEPKGVMLSHSNICWTIESYMPLLQIEPVGFRVISYLPMAHIAERMSSHYLGLAGGYEVTTCANPGDIAAYARDVHPQIMFGVPRVWEKIYAGVQGALAADADRKAKFDEAVAAAIPLRLKATRTPLTAEEQQTLDFLDEVAFKGVRELIGLDQLTFAVSGAAPIPPEMLEWFVGIGIPMSEIYGMSENTGPLTWDPYEIKPGTVGRAMPGSEVKLAEDGEVVARGGHVFQGYLNDPEKTADALDEDGWLHTGDIGEMDDEGYLRIVDRKKELIITAGGKNISPANLEAALKMIPLVGQACAIGDKRPFVGALVVLDTDVAPAWAAQRGIDATDLRTLAEHPEVVAEIEKGLADVMGQFNNAERVKKVRILTEEWLPDSEELTPTSKLKRRGGGGGGARRACRGPASRRSARAPATPTTVGRRPVGRGGWPRRRRRAPARGRPCPTSSPATGRGWRCRGRRGRRSR